MPQQSASCHLYCCAPTQPTCRVMQMPLGCRKEEKQKQEEGNEERGEGEKPLACDPIFAPINKFNAQTPGMREHIKNENYILPRSCQAHTHTHTHTYTHILYMHMCMPRQVHFVCVCACTSHLHKHNYEMENLKLHSKIKKYTGIHIHVVIEIITPRVVTLHT